jgi:hypothetical protein
MLISHIKSFITHGIYTQKIRVREVEVKFIRRASSQVAQKVKYSCVETAYTRLPHGKEALAGADIESAFLSEKKLEFISAMTSRPSNCNRVRGAQELWI